MQVGADIDGETAEDQSGWSVAMNAAGDTVIIGAYGNDGNGDIRVMPGCLGQRLNPHRLQRLGLLRRCRIQGLSPRCRAAGAPYGWGTSPVPGLPALKPRLQRPAAGDGVAGLAHTGTTTTTLAYLAVGLIGFRRPTRTG